MATTRVIDDYISIGPFEAGEIPVVYTHTFLTSDCSEALWLGPETFEAKFLFRRMGDDTVLGGDATVEDQGLEDDDPPEPTRGQVTYEWVAGDLAEPGVYEGNVWVGQGVEELASDRVKFVVRQPPVTAPTF